METAGLVFGVIPLLFTALEHYEDLIGPAKAFIQWKGELSKCVRKLYLSHTSCDQTLQLLLAPIVSKSVLEEMMADPQSRYWRDASLQEELQETLGRAYHAFQITMDDISDVMKEIACSLSIDGADKVSQQGLEAIIVANKPAVQSASNRKFQFSNRLKFTMKRRKVKGLLENLDQYNARLDGLVQKAERIEGDRYQTHKKLRFTEPWDTVRKNARMLYRALSQSWCDSHSSHSVGLLLEQRIVRKKRPNRDKGVIPRPQENCFALCLFHDACGGTGLDAEFRLLQKAARSDTKSSVRVVISAPEHPFSDSHDDEKTELAEISNICSILEQPQNSCLGFCFDEFSRLRGTYPAERQRLCNFGGTITLGDLLEASKGRLSLGERYTLSITIIASLLQLNHTPWLEFVWNKRHIAFLQTGHNAIIPAELNCPYLIRSDCEPPVNGECITSSTQRDRVNMLALAIMLLEINFAQPSKIEGLEVYDAHISQQNFDHLFKATRWLEEEQTRGNVSRAFSDAISCCFNAFINPQSSFNDDEFCKSVEEQVLLPIEEEMARLLY